jgi:hypothetical protein
MNQHRNKLTITACLVALAIGMISVQAFAQDQSLFRIKEVFAPAAIRAGWTRDVRSADVNDLIALLSPQEVWKIAEQNGLFPKGFPSYSAYMTVVQLCDAIQVHPKKSEFVDLLLKKIQSMEVPVKQSPQGWDEIAVSGNGIVGPMIQVILKICRKEDCAKIVTAVFDTRDAAKQKLFLDNIEFSPYKEEFSKLVASRSALRTEARQSKEPSPVEGPKDGNQVTRTSAPLEEVSLSRPITSESHSSRMPVNTVVIVVVVMAAFGLIWRLRKKANQ